MVEEFSGFETEAVLLLLSYVYVVVWFRSSTWVSRLPFASTVSCVLPRTVQVTHPEP